MKTEDEKPKLYTARWVLPMEIGPIENGAVAVEKNKIACVGPVSEVRAKFPDAVQEDFGEAVIMPGLINTHSHLELTIMRGYLEREESDFFAWLRKLTVAKTERVTPDDLRMSATLGAIEAARAGVTCLGDACDFGMAGIKALLDVGLRGIVFQESFGPDPQLVVENFQKLQDKVSALRELETDLVRVGVSPHAPYTVCAQQLELIADYALKERLPVMMHAAESQFEKEFILEGHGPLAEGLHKRGIEWNAPKISTIQYLNQHGILETKPLLAHCINVDETDIETVKTKGASVAHCPKSNAKLGHGFAPFADFVESGLKAGLGSDSVASNNTCDIFEEARFALLLSRATSSNAVIQAEDVLNAATIGGARALGLDNKIGSLVEGKDADLIVVSLNEAQQQPIHSVTSSLIFASSGKDVRLTVVAGREVYRGGKVTRVDEAELKARIVEIKDKLRA
jgi:5-methylthioadenosine/S-adenosylhomocysteine deaminase